MNVLAALSGFLIWIPIAYWAVTIVQAWVAAELDAIAAILSLTLVVALGALAIAPKDPRQAPLCLALVLLGTIAFPFLRARWQRHALREIDREALDKAYANLGLRPRDPLARFRVAELAWTLGMAGPALGIGESATSGRDPAMFRAEIATVHGWRAALSRVPEATRDLPCPKCRAVVPITEPFCPSCGAAYLLLRAGGEAGRSPLARRFFVAWIGLVATISAIPLATDRFGGAAAIGGLVIAVALLGWAFGGRS